MRPATRAGRRLLLEVSELTVAGDPEAVRVALRGREAMSDGRLREAIFERPVTTLGVPGPRRWRHDIDHSDPQPAAFRARATGAAGAAIGLEVGFDGEF